MGGGPPRVGMVRGAFTSAGRPMSSPRTRGDGPLQRSGSDQVLGGSARMNYQKPGPALRPSALGRCAQASPGHAQAGPMRGRLSEAESAGVLEDLADRQLGQDPHGQDHPADDLMGQLAAAGIDPPGRPEGLADGLGGDSLFESRQAIHDPARRMGRQGAMSSWHASLGLLVAWVLNKPKVTTGRDLRLFRRYCVYGLGWPALVTRPV
jgi:hypothetical protein